MEVVLVAGKSGVEGSGGQRDNRAKKLLEASEVVAVVLVLFGLIRDECELFVSGDGNVAQDVAAVLYQGRNELK